MAKDPVARNPREIVIRYPSGSTPEDRFAAQSALCSNGHSQLVVSGLLRQILLQHFADADNIINPTLRRYLEQNGVWRADERTGLYIESVGRWRPELTEARPGIVIKEGAWTWQRMGIGDQMGADWRDGRLEFGGYWRGTHTMFALGNEGAETQILASEIAKLMLWYGPIILDAFDLHRFVIVSIGELSALKESTENYVVPVTVAYMVSETWYLQEDAPRLKRIVFTTDDQVGYG